MTCDYHTLKECWVGRAYSPDLVDDEFVKQILKAISPKKVSLKHVYTTNDDRYLAVLPKFNKLPKHLQITSDKVLEELRKSN